MTAIERLQEIAHQISEGRTRSETVREILSWFNASRRGYWIVSEIRSALSQTNLRTEPDFESAWIDSEVQFLPTELAVEEAQPEATECEETITITQQELTACATLVSPPEYADPTHRISKLAASTRKPLSVSPDTKLEEAVTQMLTNDFSQLPVMTSERDVKGMITWTSIGSRLAMGKNGSVARELMEQHQEIRSDASLFSAIRIIAEHQYVLVRGHDQKISGIVTASDLSLQFQQLAEPFLLLGEIENHVRRIISQRFTPTELEPAKDQTDTERIVTSVADLTFGEYIRLLENPERWDKLNICIDRKTFIEKLESVRGIRNDVMHFDPDGIPEKDLQTLREFARFLQKLQSIGVI